MNVLSYLIIEAGINDAYYNTASLVNLYPREPKFVGYEVRELERQFGKLIDEGVFIALPGPAKNTSYQTKGAFLSIKKNSVGWIRRNWRDFKGRFRNPCWRPTIR